MLQVDSFEPKESLSEEPANHAEQKACFHRTGTAKACGKYIGMTMFAEIEELLSCIATHRQ